MSIILFQTVKNILSYNSSNYNKFFMIYKKYKKS